MAWTHSLVLITVDNDAKLITIANQYFSDDKRVSIVCEDGAKWINNYNGANHFDLVFADAWPGKYSEIDEILSFDQGGGLLCYRRHVCPAQLAFWSSRER